ncbi:hypothetical protein TNCV_4830661 [Trichonephila clavipes]|nr:hypothetical protein TNCV_4830661 [Trichonephila clavipes]
MCNRYYRDGKFSQRNRQINSSEISNVRYHKGGSAEFTVLLKEKVCGGTRSHIPEVLFQFPEQNSTPINWKSTMLAEKSFAPSVIVLCHRYLPQHEYKFNSSPNIVHAFKKQHSYAYALVYVFAL